MTEPFDIGADAQRTGGDNRDWRPMVDAPRDGTVVELKNSYGVAPCYSLALWSTDGSVLGEGGPQARQFEEHAWRSPNPNDPGFYKNEDQLQWRPYEGDPAAYVDPTGGAQDDSGYWRGAVAAKYGMSADAFEARAAANAASRPPRALSPGQTHVVTARAERRSWRSWWRRFWGLAR